jgi:hypothetical protein
MATDLGLLRNRKLWISKADWLMAGNWEVREDWALVENPGFAPLSWWIHLLR